MTITSSSVGTTQQTHTDGSGEFIVQGLLPGSYSIKVDAPGFATQEIKAAELLVNQPLTPTIGMSVASTSAELTVTAAPCA